MISPICIYTNEIDSYFKALQRRHHGAAPKIGVRIVGTWVNRPQNEFIWVRTYKDKAELEASRIR
jgi:hypothetical protein